MLTTVVAPGTVASTPRTVAPVRVVQLVNRCDGGIPGGSRRPGNRPRPPTVPGPTDLGRSAGCFHAGSTPARSCRAGDAAVASPRRPRRVYTPRVCTRRAASILYRAACGDLEYGADTSDRHSGSSAATWGDTVVLRHSIHVAGSVITGVRVRPLPAPTGRRFDDQSALPGHIFQAGSGFGTTSRGRRMVRLASSLPGGHRRIARVISSCIPLGHGCRSTLNGGWSRAGSSSHRHWLASIRGGTPSVPSRRRGWPGAGT